MKFLFKITGLDKELFTDLMAMPDHELINQNAHWLTADESPGYPCRVSLIDAKIGERVLACTFEHHQVNSAYRASGPIFVRETAVNAKLSINEVPDVLLNRRLSLRGYNSDHMMKAAILIDCQKAQQIIDGIQDLLNDPQISYIHIHNALPGCFSCEVSRLAI